MLSRNGAAQGWRNLGGPRGKEAIACWDVGALAGELEATVLAIPMKKFRANRS
jgi:hypothetical protein